MKRLSVWCLLLFTGCTQSAIDEGVSSSQDEFYAKIEEAASGSDSRTFLDEKIRLRWTADDRITIFKKTSYNRQFKFMGVTGANAGGFAQVSTDDEFWYGATLPYNYAAYPHSNATSFHEDGYFVLTMPAEQTYAENSVGLGANTMVAMSEDGQLMFKNVGSFLRVRLWGDSQQVQSVTLTTKGKEVLAGPAKITPSLTAGPLCEMTGSTKYITLNCTTPVTVSDSEDTPTDFWIVLPPTTFADGFTVSVQNQYGNTQTFDIDQAFKFEQNTYYNLKREVTMGLIPDNQIWYTVTETRFNNVDVSDLGEESFGASVISHTYDDTTKKGVITFDGPVTKIGERAFRNARFATLILPQTVTTIEAFAFNQCSFLTKIHLGNQITSIGRNAFWNCGTLSEIQLPKSLTEIGSSAFHGCRELTHIDIPEGITLIDEHCFSNCSKLATITLPSTLLTIAERAFKDTGLKEVNIPNSVQNVLGNPFIRCQELAKFTGKFASADGHLLIVDNEVSSVASAGTTTIIIPDDVTTIGYQAFEGSTMECVKLPESIQSIIFNPFVYCSNLSTFQGKYASADGRCLIVNNEIVAYAPANTTVPYTIPNTVESIGRDAFRSCSYEAITIPSNVKKIGDYAFYMCYELEQLSFDEGVEIIGDGAFYWCSAIQQVTLPASVKEIGNQAFRECQAMTEFYCKATTPPIARVEDATDTWNVFSSIADGFVIYVPASDDDSIINAYKAADGWKDYAEYIEEYDFAAEE